MSNKALILQGGEDVNKCKSRRWI